MRKCRIISVFPYRNWQLFGACHDCLVCVYAQRRPSKLVCFLFSANDLKINKINSPRHKNFMDIHSVFFFSLFVREVLKKKKTLALHRSRREKRCADIHGGFPKCLLIQRSVLTEKESMKHSIIFKLMYKFINANKCIMFFCSVPRRN